MTYYYFVFFLSLYLAFLFIKAIVEKEIKTAFIASALAVAMIIIGVGSNANKLLPTNEYTKYSTRGKSDLKQTANAGNQTGGLDRDYIVGYSSGKDDFYSFLVPNFKGSNSGVQLITNETAKPEMGKNAQLVGQVEGLVYNQYGEIIETYWGGTDLAGGGVYCSVLIAALFLLGLVFVKSPVKWIILFAAGITIMLSWGKNYMDLTNWFIDHFPMYNKFRAVNSMIIVATFCVPLLASFMLARLVNEPEFLEKNLIGETLAKKENRGKLTIYILAIIVFILIAIARLIILSSSLVTFTPIIFSAISFLIIAFWILRDPGKFKNKYLVVSGLVFVTLTLVLMYVAPTSFQSFLKPEHMVDRMGVVMSEKQIITEALTTQKVDDATINTVISSIQEGRIAIFKADVLRSLFVMLLGTVAIGLFAFKVYKWPVMVAIVGVIVLADVWDYDKRFLSADTEVNGEKLFQMPKKADAKFSPTPADEVILNDKAIHKRVLNLSVSPFNDGTTSYWHQSLGGYSGAKIKRYQELIEKGIYPDINTVYSAVSNPAKLDSVLATVQVLNMLNTKYFIFPTEQGTVPLPNRHANGPAWTVADVKFVLDADAELGGLKTINTKTQVLIDDDFKGDLNLSTVRPDSTARITMTKLSPKLLEYDYESKEDQVVVFSEIYYPAGWKAYIDGTESKIVRADYVLRALFVPKGKHKIEFIFDPASYKKGEMYSLICSGILVVLLLGGIGLEIRNRRKVQPKK